MNAKLEFNLDDPDDRKAHLRCTHALDMACLLWDIEQERVKMVNGKKSEADAMQEIKNLITCTDLNIDDLL